MNWQDYLGNGNRSQDQRDLLKVQYVGRHEAGPVPIPYRLQSAGKGTIIYNVSEDRLKTHLKKEILDNDTIHTLTNGILTERATSLSHIFL